MRVFRTFDEISSESYWRSSAYEGTFMPTICFSVGHIYRGYLSARQLSIRVMVTLLISITLVDISIVN